RLSPLKTWNGWWRRRTGAFPNESPRKRISSFWLRIGRKRGDPMLQQGDLIVLFLLVGAIVAIAVRPLRMRAKSAVPWSESDGGFSGEVPGLLAAHGYEVVAGKQRVPVSVRIGERIYDSRLYIDYIARRQQE